MEDHKQASMWIMRGQAGTETKEWKDYDIQPTSVLVNQCTSVWIVEMLFSCDIPAPGLGELRDSYGEILSTALMLRPLWSCWSYHLYFLCPVSVYILNPFQTPCNVLRFQSTLAHLQKVQYPVTG
jgi:hypothetical protein